VRETVRAVEGWRWIQDGLGKETLILADNQGKSETGLVRFTRHEG
jgi:hypothetical protein